MTPSQAVAPSSSWNLRGVLAYLALLLFAVVGFFAIRSVGMQLTAPEAPADAIRLGNATGGKVDVVLHVVATLAAVIGVGFLLGRLCRWIGQPPVIGEVIAGILLGPSLLGAISPAAMHALIPSATVDPGGQVPAALKAISQLGVILYMFLVGLELNAAELRGRAHSTVAVSHASIVVPFVLGAVLSLWLYPVLSYRGVPFTSFALFIGVAMAITAFPVLARILADRGLDKTPLGVVALGCAAADDVTAWCLLALVVGIAQARIETAIYVGIGAAVFIGVMFLVVRPVLLRVVHRWEKIDRPTPAALAGILVLVLLASLCTEAIGIHAVFGAFLLGAVVPHDSRIARELGSRFKDLVAILLLPAFFAFTGMRTEIGLVSGWQNWLICGAIVVVATLGKFGGTLLAARLTGQNWREAAALGTLMNTRGLMELIVLNIGLDLGVISPTLFAMMVIMALVTTILTAPVLAWLIPDQQSATQPQSA